MKILLLGFGKIGRTIFDLLHHSGRYQVAVGDCHPSPLAEATLKGAQTFLVDAAQPETLHTALHGQAIVINALPHHLNMMVSSAAVAAGVHYFDLSEDVASTRHIKHLAATAKTALMPQCGLAPGFIAIAAHDLFSRFDKVEDVMCRVGALPIYPTNTLKYNLTWSTDGLINEYCMPCEAIIDGRMHEVLPLEGLEHFSLDGTEYECFNTSGGVGTLCETLLGKTQQLTYKTIRYTGHCTLAKFLLNELGLRDKRAVLRDILEASMPATLQDEVIVFASVRGFKQGKLMQENFMRKIYGRSIAGTFRSAIQLTTASSLCAIVDLFATHKLPQSGFIRQEQVSLDAFLANEFGRVYGDS